MEKKSFGIALLLWFLGGVLGFHRVYIKDSFVPLLWYWLATFCTIGIFPIIDLFLIKGMIERQYLDEKVRNMM